MRNDAFILHCKEDHSGFRLRYFTCHSDLILVEGNKILYDRVIVNYGDFVFQSTIFTGPVFVQLLFITKVKKLVDKSTSDKLLVYL